MRRLAHLAALPVVLLLAACGGGNDITVTNENNVVLNDAQANFASTNDGEVAADDMAAMNAANAADANMTMTPDAAANDAMSNGTGL